MIHGVVIVNHRGEQRLTRFYTRHAFGEEQFIVQKLHQAVLRRPASGCNFVQDDIGLKQDGLRIIFKKFATLFFIFLVDESENPLSILDLITIFVEALNSVFPNVCELDIMKDPLRANMVLDCIVEGGLILETRPKAVASHFQRIAK
eukprot:gnl/Chilomastix_cuspidata/3058.p2 GENE.gnl/Chilomastix_cuspidata/3058~~gnl/Chilomastix_cuspidata/3058.p2  ORF type:complete len:147 (+),score=61.90 gnl/Chilomastix_cuspidata/3058:26-466(+)